MRRLISAALLAAAIPAGLGLAAPATAQSASDQQRWDNEQARYQAALDRYNGERQRYLDARRAWRQGYGAGYGAPPPPPPPPGDRYGYGAPPPPPPGAYGDDRYDPNYDASRFYRDGPGYQERVLAYDDRVYRGSDGRYYCRRSDGTTGLIVGAVGGGVLGNVIDGGHSRAAGTLIGAAVGALAGRAVDRDSSEIRCR